MKPVTPVNYVEIVKARRLDEYRAHFTLLTAESANLELVAKMQHQTPKTPCLKKSN